MQPPTARQIDYDEVDKIKPAAKRKGRRANPCKEFGKLCSRRAKKDHSLAWDIAGNGRVIEQQQILTTQNLAPLIRKTDRLQERLVPHLPKMAEDCFRWIIRQLRIQDPNVHSRLIKIKNSAYAWRQTLVYLSLMTDQEVDTFIISISGCIGEQSEEFQQSFCFAIDGLKNSISVHRGSLAEMPEDHQTFVGWTIGDHPLLMRKGK